MNIQSRLIVVLSTIFAMAVLGFGFVLLGVVLPGFQHLEQRHAEASMSRLNNALTGELDELERLVVDWSYWDDSWVYMADRNKAYENSNLVDSTLEDAALAMIWMVDAEGITVWRRFLPRDSTRTVEVEILPETLPAGHPVRQVALDQNILRGFMMIGDRPVMLAASPILPSSGGGAARGTLVFARHFDAEQIQVLSERIQYSLRGLSPGDAELQSLPPAIAGQLASLPARSPVLDYGSPDHIEGMLRIDGISGAPQLVLESRIDRDITRFGNETVFYSALLLLAAVVTALGSGFLLSRRTIARPVYLLTRHIEHIGETGDLDAKISLPGRNELARMATAFNRMQERLQKLTHFDPVTDLPNRVLFADRARQIIAKARREERKAAIIFVDLDRFKNVNDTFGHEYGDAVLRGTAERLTQRIRSSDTVARFGGDEFAIVAGSFGLAADVEILARSLRDGFEAPITADGRESFVGGSIGLALFPDDGDDVETLLKNADIAMYRAKAAGGGYEFFGIEASQAVEQRHLLENELQQAVRGNEFDLFYQPQVRVDDRQICGAEALIRWRHPVDGWRTASRFMPFAEEIGMFRRLDEWVLRRALSQCGEVSLPPDFVVALNLSSREFETEDLADMLGQVLQAGRNAVPVLELEITENALVRPSPANEAAIRMLRSLDIVVSLDDFGTGYSSLSYLKTLPVGALKIDRTFVQDLPENPESQSIVRAILSLGQSLSYRVVAEGVETQAQHDILKEFGCQIAQGNFYAEPEAPEVFFARFC